MVQQQHFSWQKLENGQLTAADAKIFSELSTANYLQTLEQLSEHAQRDFATQADPNLANRLPVWQIVLAAIARRQLSAAAAETDADHDRLSAGLTRLYQSLGPQLADRHQLLTLLAKQARPASLQHLVDRLTDDPPRGAAATAPLIPLFQLPPRHTATLFPALLEALANPELAPGILDLANHLCRTHQMASHPAAARTEQLNRLAEAVVAQLDQAQSQAQAATNPRQAQEKIAVSLPLAISLCDTLGLIGDERSIPTLERMMELQHRRLRCEAATALARLGSDAALDTLASLAVEPSVRLRVLAYAEELGHLDRVPEEYRLPAARGEAELVTYLSEPTQMGLPPARCELVDTRPLAWPGYDEPRDCYLFRFDYSLIDDQGQPRMLSNVGIAGPLVHAFHADLADLPVEDIYAIFAGWQAEHQEIGDEPFREALLMQNAPLRDLHSRINSEFANVQPLVVGNFLGDLVLIASAARNSTQGIALAHGTQTEWYPMTGRSRPLGPEEVWYLYKGRRLLAHFNPDWSRETGDESEPL